MSKLCSKTSLIVFFGILSTHFYNLNKERTERNLISVTENLYFQKNLEHLINSLKPKYKRIQHVVSKGENFNNILKNYNISSNEITKITNALSKIQKSKTGIHKQT